ncbi:hypothetical protein F5884DRAFT_788875 [Xylogone sp. PMI_703]|nr:hypothetical protein F5884DRAFT_788875 [Xylogone sp. PMI_703]
MPTISPVTSGFVHEDRIAFIDGSSSQLRSPGGSRDKMNACLECRKVKMRCRLDKGDTVCERCARKSFECVFREHRRGRKPGTKITRKKDASDRPGHDGPPINYDYMSDNGPAHVDSDAERPADPSSLQPAGVLNREAMRGKFSLQSILSTDHHPVGDVSEEFGLSQAQDVITLGLVNPTLAESLFDSFINVLNPYISQLDPVLHTFPYVRRKSPFLLNSILAAAAKIYNPALYPSLRKHAEDAYLETVRTGAKSTEIVQAIMILTYWKEPEDTRAWVTLGYVIRMCMDLGWHKLNAKSTQHRQGMTEKQRREARNVERTWLVLFVYDRSISLQTGRPWMIERNDFIEGIEVWGKDVWANDNDVLLCAFVTLRLVTSEGFGLLNHRGGSLQSMESLLKVLNNSIDKWEEKWLCIARGESESCHPFLIRFYGTHLRLQLFSLPLHKVLGSKSYEIPHNLESLWISYSSAIEMLKLVSSFSSRLYFAQDSVHIMTAYSAAFLIKLLLSASSSIVNQIEQDTIEVIRTAARVFSQQAAPPGSSCFLQAKFLANVVLKYEEARRKPRPGRLPRNDEETDYKSGIAASSGMIFSQPSTPADGHQQHRVPLHTGASRVGAAEDTTNFDFAQYDTSRYNPPELMESTGGDYGFMDDEAWAAMFASAGFNLEEGVFFS